MPNISLRCGVSINSPGIVTASERFTWPCAGYSIKAQRRHCGVPDTPGNWSPSTRSSGGLSTLTRRSGSIASYESRSPIRSGRSSWHRRGAMQQCRSDRSRDPGDDRSSMGVQSEVSCARLRLARFRSPSRDVGVSKSPWPRKGKTVAEPMVRRLAAGASGIRTAGPPVKRDGVFRDHP